MKRFLRDSVVTYMGVCALSVSTVLTHSWGSAGDVLAFIPRGHHAICLAIRFAYGTFVNEAGRIPRQLAANATIVYETLKLVIGQYLSDQSVSRKMCTSRARSRHRRPVCYPKEQVKQVSDLAIPCIQKILKNTVPELVDAALIGMSTMLTRVGNSAIVNYVGR